MGFGSFLRKVARGFGSVVKPGLSIAQGVLTPLSVVRPELAGILAGVKAVNNVLEGAPG